MSAKTQRPFLPLYKQLVDKKINKFSGLWLIHGDEPLLHQWFLEKARPVFAAHNQNAQRVYLDGPKDWIKAINALNGLSLFGEDSVVVINHAQKIDKALLPKLQDFAKAAQAGNNPNCLLYQIAGQNKKDQNDPLFRLFLEYGVVVDASARSEQMRRQLLVQKAHEFGLRLNDDAWRFLLEHTENHLLSAYQALWQLSYIHQNAPADIDVACLTETLAGEYQYSVFHLRDTLLQGDSAKALRILDHLRTTGSAPSAVLWHIAKEVRLILQLQSGKSASELGVWQSKSALYRQAARRGVNNALLCAVYNADKSVKGVASDNPWRQLQRLCLDVCGANPLPR